MKLQPKQDLSQLSAKDVLASFIDFPSIKNVGAKIVDFTDNLDHVILKIPFIDETKNFIGITYGGTMYAATDALYVTMLWYRLGKDYIAIDKHSTVENLRPGTSELTVEFYLPDEVIATIIKTLATEKSLTQEFVIELYDEKNKLVCRITKIIYIRRNPSNNN